MFLIFFLTLKMYLMPVQHLFFCITKYPSSIQYQEMVNAVFNRWPHLAKELPTYDDARILWKHRLKTHFKQCNRLPYEKQDSILVKKLMDTTFSHRRKLIVTQLVKIADLANQYPILCNEDHVSCII